MGDDTEWMKLPTDEKVQHKVCSTSQYIAFLLVHFQHFDCVKLQGKGF